jgi:ABC-type Co2+ transport system permease subunit
MYVCTQLSQPTAESVQTCIAWTEQTSFAESYAITQQQANDLSMAVVGFLVVFFVFRHLRNAI